MIYAVVFLRVFNILFKPCVLKEYFRFAGAFTVEKLWRLIVNYVLFSTV